MNQQEDIQKEAKEIMDNFIKALKGIELEDEYNLERDISTRQELNNSPQANDEFKQKFLSNANKVSGDYIVANKGKWVK
ncbi:MAG: Asp-tRNA(Asn) amidotransferase GatCAB subunit C [Nanoarchaeota archaeon]